MIKAFFFALAMSASLPPSRGNKNPKNVLGFDLEICSTQPLTGWHRTGYCQTDDYDYGTHTVCAQMTQEVRKRD